MNNGGVVLLDCDDEGCVTVRVGHVGVGVLPGQQLLHPIYSPTEGRHQESRAGRVVVRLEEREEGGCPLLPHLHNPTPWGTWRTLRRGQAGEESWRSGGIIITGQTTATRQRGGQSCSWRIFQSNISIILIVLLTHCVILALS